MPSCAFYLTSYDLTGHIHFDIHTLPFILDTCQAFVSDPILGAVGNELLATEQIC